MNASFDYNPFTQKEDEDDYDLDLFHFWPNYAHKATFHAINNASKKEDSLFADFGDKDGDLSSTRYSMLMGLN